MIKLGVVMDPITSICFQKDSTLAMLWEAEKRKWKIFYFEIGDLFLREGQAYGHAKSLRVFNNPTHWYEFGEEKIVSLDEMTVILIRKDPPFDLDYLYATQILDHAEQAGVRVINKPQALRDANEKLFCSWFPHCIPPTLVSKRINELIGFLHEQKEIICKPLHAMGGYSIFYLRSDDPNASVIFEMMTANGTAFMMVQRFIPEIVQGDKRILLVHGEPIPFALARIPKEGGIRGNLAAGAKGIAVPLTERDHWICQQIGSTLYDKGLDFVGIDVIGDFLTEINVTSPTCIRELDEQCSLNISALFLDGIEDTLSL